MRLLLFKACEYVTILHNGRQTLVGMFENIVLPTVPIEHPPFFLCIQLEFDQEDMEQQLQIEAVLIDQDGRTMMDFSAAGAAPHDPRGPARLFLQFLVPPLRFESVGDYRFDLLCNGRKIAEERIPVLLAERFGP